MLQANIMAYAGFQQLDYGTFTAVPNLVLNEYYWTDLVKSCGELIISQFLSNY